jgi:hypothetical protein
LIQYVQKSRLGRKSMQAYKKYTISRYQTKESIKITHHALIGRDILFQHTKQRCKSSCRYGKNIAELYPQGISGGIIKVSSEKALKTHLQAAPPSEFRVPLAQQRNSLGKDIG